MKKPYYLSIIILLSIPGMMLGGCKREDIYDSNTSNVKNSPYREEGEEEQVQIYESMQNIKNAVKEILGDNYWPDQLMSKLEFLRLTGIDDEMYDELWAENMSIETDIDMMIIVLAKEENVSEVEKALNDFRNELIDKYANRPQKLAKASASRIEVIDRYVCFIQLGADISKIPEEEKESIESICQQENERAVDAIEKKILE